MYEEFWRLAPTMKGAVTAAAKIKHAQAYTRPDWNWNEAIDADEAAALRLALERLPRAHSH